MALFLYSLPRSSVLISVRILGFYLNQTFLAQKWPHHFLILTPKKDILLFFTSEAGFFTSFHDFNDTVYIYSIPRYFVSPNHGLVVGDKSASPFLIEEFSQLDYLIARFLNLNFGRRTKCVTCNQCLTTISWLFRVILKGRVNSKNYINQLFSGRSERIWTSDPYVPKVEFQ